MCCIWRFKMPSIAGKEVLVKSVIQAHPFLCVSSNSLWGYVRNSLKWQLLGGGGRSIQNWRCIGLNGRTYVFLNAMVDWVSGSFNLLILLCWLSKGRKFWMIQTQSLQEFGGQMLYSLFFPSSQVGSCSIIYLVKHISWKENTEIGIVLVDWKWRDWSFKDRWLPAAESHRILSPVVTFMVRTVIFVGVSQLFILRLLLNMDHDYGVILKMWLTLVWMVLLHQWTK